MGQPRILGAAAVVILASCLAFFFATRPHAVPAPPAPNSSDRPRIASITPAGTDLVVGIGAAGDLVACSNYDDDREGLAGLPRIGDYNSLDWEKIAAARPTVLLLQYAEDRTPVEITQRCASMGIRIVNLKLDTLAEICAGMKQIGEAIDRQSDAQRAVDAFRGRLEAVRDRVVGTEPVKAVIVTDDDPISLAGTGEFLDELLTIAGGENAAKSLGKPYPSVDREGMMKLAPQVVIRLEPDGERKPQIVEQGDQVWYSLVDLPAVKNHKVFVITDWYAEMPGYRVAGLAERFADLLHPETMKEGTTRAAGRNLTNDRGDVAAPALEIFPSPGTRGEGQGEGFAFLIAKANPKPPSPNPAETNGLPGGGNRRNSAKSECPGRAAAADALLAGVFQ